jgi:aminoglycoside 6'-N-acetyltransferase I
VKIVDLRPDDVGIVTQVAEIMVEAFVRSSEFVKTLDAALAEVNASFAPGRLSRVALDEFGNVQGWAGGTEQYGGHVYELHQLAVKVGAQHQGIGRALVQDLEEQARERGAMTVVLGTDDDFGGTSLYGADVYPEVCSHISTIRNIDNHPYEFYQKCGYVIVGIVPDANGFGKPDILMAKRVGVLKGGNEDA